MRFPQMVHNKVLLIATLIHPAQMTNLAEQCGAAGIRSLWTLKMKHRTAVILVDPGMYPPMDPDE